MFCLSSNVGIYLPDEKKFGIEDDFVVCDKTNERDF
jgi:hypothetical protein